MTIAIIDFFIVAVILIGDLLSKHYAASYLPTHGNCYVAIKDVLTFRYSENTGAAFGMFENSRVFLCVFVGLVLAALLGFMIYHIVKGKYKKKGGIFLHVTLSMILAGGIGNLVDRIAFGYVRDFIEYTVVYTLFKRDFAICNVADVFLTVGVILVMIYLTWSTVIEARKEKEKKLAAANETTSFSAEASVSDEISDDRTEGPLPIEPESTESGKEDQDD